MRTVIVEVNAADPTGDTKIDVTPNTKLRVVDIDCVKWKDANIDSDPTVGWNSTIASLFYQFKQSKIHNYMRLIYSVGSSNKKSKYRAVKKNVEFEFTETGRLYIKANDIYKLFYRNNSGTATLTLEIED